VKATTKNAIKIHVTAVSSRMDCLIVMICGGETAKASSTNQIPIYPDTQSPGPELLLCGSLRQICPKKDGQHHSVPPGEITLPGDLGRR
jgi:hypothetical protein